MKKVLRYKSDILAYISCAVMIIGTILPIINLEGTTKSFIIENGKLVLVCAVIGAILYLFKLGYFSFLPAISSLVVLYYFYDSINESIEYLNTVSEGTASYEIGFYLIIAGSCFLFISSIINYFDHRKNRKQQINSAQEIVDSDEVKGNLETIDNKEQVDEQIEFIYCKNCGATVRKEQKVCSFCDSKLINE